MEAVKGARADVICSSGPPMSNHIASYLVSKRFRIPLIVDLRDPWTIRSSEVPSNGGITRRISQFFEQHVLHHAAAITVTTDHVARTLADSFPGIVGKIHVVLNGYDGDRRPAKAESGNRLSMLFAGELYVNRSPFEFLEAVERLLSRADVDASRLEIIFVGNCDSFQGVQLRDWMTGKRCDSVTRILPPVRAIELEPYTERATVLMNFSQGQSWAIPAKTYEHMASGREMLVFCERESATGRLIEGIPGVCMADPRDSAQLDDTLNDLYQRHVVEGVSRAPSEEAAAPFSRESQSDLFVNIVEEVAAGK